MKRILMGCAALVACCCVGCASSQSCASKKDCGTKACGDCKGDCGSDCKEAGCKDQAKMCPDCKDGQVCAACKAAHHG